ncbi:hypothetical protein ACFL5F_07660, partial [Planctomycetota bacterium]
HMDTERGRFDASMQWSPCEIREDLEEREKLIRYPRISTNKHCHDKTIFASRKSLSWLSYINRRNSKVRKLI